MVVWIVCKDLSYLSPLNYYIDYIQYYYDKDINNNRKTKYPCDNIHNSCIISHLPFFFLMILFSHFILSLLVYKLSNSINHNYFLHLFILSMYVIIISTHNPPTNTINTIDLMVDKFDIKIIANIIAKINSNIAKVIISIIFLNISFLLYFNLYLRFP